MGFPETGDRHLPRIRRNSAYKSVYRKELTKYLIFTGRLISAEVALSIGLVDYLFQPDEIEEKILGLITDRKVVPKKGGERMKTCPGNSGR